VKVRVSQQEVPNFSRESAGFTARSTQHHQRKYPISLVKVQVSQQEVPNFSRESAGFQWSGLA